MILFIVNKLPKFIGVYLKNGILRRILSQKLAEETSQKIVFLSAEKSRNECSNGTVGRNRAEIERVMSYKKDALEHFKFIANPTEFQKGVVYPLVINLVTFLVGFLMGIIVDR